MPDHTHFTPLGKDELTILLREHDITPTQQRLDIAQILFARPQHLSAEQVLAMANRTDTQVSKATVYNTLGLFARKGLVREVIVDPAKVFYDPTTVPHHHFYNVDTGMLLDIDADRVELGTLPAVPQGTATEGVEVIIRLRNQDARNPKA